MKKRFIIIYTGCFFIILGILFAIYFYMTHRVDTSAMDYIKGFMKGKYVYNDLAGDIGVTEQNDLGYEVKGRYHIVIHYGLQIIDMNRNCFEDEEFLKKLKQIGISIKWREDENGNVEYRLEYFGDEIQRFDFVAHNSITNRMYAYSGQDIHSLRG